MLSHTHQKIRLTNKQFNSLVDSLPKQKPPATNQPPPLPVLVSPVFPGGVFVLPLSVSVVFPTPLTTLVLLLLLVLACLVLITKASVGQSGRALTTTTMMIT